MFDHPLPHCLQKYVRRGGASLPGFVPTIPVPYLCISYLRISISHLVSCHSSLVTFPKGALYDHPFPYISSFHRLCHRPRHPLSGGRGGPRRLCPHPPPSDHGRCRRPGGLRHHGGIPHPHRQRKAVAVHHCRPRGQSLGQTHSRPGGDGEQQHQPRRGALPPGRGLRGGRPPGGHPLLQQGLRGPW